MSPRRRVRLELGLALAALVAVPAGLRAQSPDPDQGYGGGILERGAEPASIGRLLDPVVRGWGGRVGVAVYAVDRGRPLYLHEADRSLVPASNMKIFTTAAALERLGPDFQYTTSLYAAGPIANGTIDGDLVLVGRGDPTLSGRFYADSAPYVLDRLVAELRRNGVRRVTGDLVGDATYFDDTRTAPGWEGTNLLWWYGARTSALSFNDNVVTLEVWPGPSVGSPPMVGFTPRAEALVVANRARTVGRRGGRSIGVRRRADLGGYEITGRISIRSGPLRYVVSVEDPAAYSVSVLRDRLRRAGIVVEGEDRVRHRWSRPPDGGDLRLVASHVSPRMIEIVRIINKQSQNFFAEQVLKTLGAVFADDGSFAAGAEVVEAVLETVGLEGRPVSIRDGSGLSRDNRVTARLVAELLVAIRARPWFDDFYDSLLIAGEDGDRRRLDGPGARGNVHSKTGTLRGVSALSGYVTTSDGELLAFSVVSNGLPRGKGQAIAIEDAIAERLASYSVWTSPPLEGASGR